MLSGIMPCHRAKFIGPVYSAQQFENQPAWMGIGRVDTSRKKAKFQKKRKKESSEHISHHERCMVVKNGLGEQRSERQLAPHTAGAAPGGCLAVI